ncbi:MAG: hypothetical protein ACTSYI_05345 [Promethearchaeota archaeon]
MSGNVANNNWDYGIFLRDSSNNIIWDNIFSDNLFSNAYSNDNNTWDNGTHVRPDPLRSR